MAQITAEDVISRIDPVAYIGQFVQLKRSGTSYKACCPFHNEKTPSFSVTKEGWHCFGGCATGGNVATFAMKYHGWDFPTALRELAAYAGMDVAGSNRAKQRSAPAPRVDSPSEPPPQDWQERAEHIIRRASATLWAPNGYAALKYLRERGLTDETIQAARLGYVPPADQSEMQFGKVVFPDWLKQDGKPRRVPCGIVIPHIASGRIWGVRVRTDAWANNIMGASKYMGIEGGSKALYWADEIQPGFPVLITEGEFDALIIWQVSHKWWCDVHAVSLCSASNYDINQRWWKYLQGAPDIMIRADADAAGERAITELRKISRGIRAVQVPETKDINDFYKVAGSLAVAQWLDQLVAEVA